MPNCNLYTRSLANSEPSHWATSSRNISVVHPATNGHWSGRRGRALPPTGRPPPTTTSRGRGSPATGSSRRPARALSTAHSPPRQAMEGSGRGRATSAPQRGGSRGQPAAAPRRAGVGGPAVVRCGAKGRALAFTASAAGSRKQAPAAAAQGGGSRPATGWPLATCCLGGGGGEGPACHHAKGGEDKDAALAPTSSLLPPPPTSPPPRPPGFRPPRICSQDRRTPGPPATPAPWNLPRDPAAMERTDAGPDRWEPEFWIDGKLEGADGEKEVRCGG